MAEHPEVEEARFWLFSDELYAIFPGSRTVDGAESVLRTLAASGVEVCFRQPGDVEMRPGRGDEQDAEVRGVLTLFEGVASAAADGYARMAERPRPPRRCCTSARASATRSRTSTTRTRARTPMVNLVGDHAVAHKPLGAPLASDIESIARPASHWLRTTRDARSAATDTALAGARG